MKIPGSGVDYHVCNHCGALIETARLSLHNKTCPGLVTYQKAAVQNPQ